MGKKSKIKYTLIFNRKGTLKKSGEALIQIKAYQDRKNRYFSTGIYIQPQYWDQRHRKVKHFHPNQYVYNQSIQAQLAQMEAFEIRMINRYGSFSIDRLHEYKKNAKSDIPASFTEFFEQELKNHRLKPDSYKMYLLTLNKLKAFRKTVYFEDISFGLINEFDRYLFKKGLGTNSVGKHHDRLKTYINMAIKNDFLKIDQNPYNKFKVGGEEPDRVYLTIEELNQMEELAIPPGKKHLERIRDVFLMATYTGLRYGDVTSLTAAHVVRSQRGISLSLKAEKTGKNLTLPLYFLFREEEAEQSKPEKLISKYLKIIDALGEDEDARNIPFFSVTNQYMNRALKEIARMAGINKNLTSHVARRTFATIMATKVKAPVLQRLLQHARPDMTNIYIQLSNHHIENELEKIDWN